ncbi:hypothetical protein ES703_110297 [subsurface metagenome]
MTFERFDEGAVFELIRKVQPALVPRVRIKVDHDLVHASKLGVQHTLYLACIERRENAFRPFGELDFEFQSLLIPCVAIGIPEAGVRLMQGVPRRPQAVQVEAGGFDFSLGYTFHELSAVDAIPVDYGAQVPIAPLVLNFLEFGDNIIRSPFEFLIAGYGVHQADGGEIMPGNVARQLAAVHGVPASVALSLGFQASANTVAGKHTVRFQLKQIFGCHVLGSSERPSCQSDFI